MNSGIVIERFVGSYNQQVPSYSAIKLHGKRFSDLCRAGKEVPARSRVVTINDIQLVHFKPSFFPEVELVVFSF